MFALPHKRVAELSASSENPACVQNTETPDPAWQALQQAGLPPNDRASSPPRQISSEFMCMVQNDAGRIGLLAGSGATLAAAREDAFSKAVSLTGSGQVVSVVPVCGNGLPVLVPPSRLTRMALQFQATRLALTEPTAEQSKYARIQSWLRNVSINPQMSEESTSGSAT